MAPESTSEFLLTISRQRNSKGGSGEVVDWSGFTGVCEFGWRVFLILLFGSQKLKYLYIFNVLGYSNLALRVILANGTLGRIIFFGIQEPPSANGCLG